MSRVHYLSIFLGTASASILKIYTNAGITSYSKTLKIETLIFQNTRYFEINLRHT